MSARSDGVRSVRAAMFAALALVAPAAEANPPRRPALSAYRASVNHWHDTARVPAPRFTGDGALVLRVWSINGLGSAEVAPRTPQGGFDEAACAEVSRVLGDSRAQRTAPIDRRLIEVLYQVARHFRAGQVSVMSGYRAASRGSNHQLGRAVDVVVPGVADAEVAAYAQTLGLLGVGLYPVGGFVHLDVRERSYFWVDRSGPGRPSRRRRRGRRARSGGMQEVHGTIGQRADAEARARGVFPYGGTTGASAPANGSAAASGAPGAADDGDGDGDG